MGVLLGRALLPQRTALLKDSDVAGLSPEMVSEGQRALLRALLHKDPAQRPTTWQALQHPFFQGKPPVRTCIICMDEECRLGDGVECTSRAGPSRHFTCGACFQQHVAMFAEEKQIKVLRIRNAQVYTP